MCAGAGRRKSAFRCSLFVADRRHGGSHAAVRRRGAVDCALAGVQLLPCPCHLSFLGLCERDCADLRLRIVPPRRCQAARLEQLRSARKFERGAVLIGKKGWATSCSPPWGYPVQRASTHISQYATACRQLQSSRLLLKAPLRCRETRRLRCELRPQACSICSLLQTLTPMSGTVQLYIRLLKGNQGAE